MKSCPYCGARAKLKRAMLRPPYTCPKCDGRSMLVNEMPSLAPLVGGVLVVGGGIKAGIIPPTLLWITVTACGSVLLFGLIGGVLWAKLEPIPGGQPIATNNPGSK